MDYYKFFAQFLNIITIYKPLIFREVHANLKAKTINYFLSSGYEIRV